MRAEHRAFLREHSDVGTFVDQHIAAGAYSQRLAQIYENYFGHDKWVDDYLYIYGTKEHFIVFLETLFNREAVKSFNPLKTKIFTSPWAVRRWLVVVVVVICIELGNNSVFNVIIICIEFVVFREDEEFLISTLGLLGRYLQYLLGRYLKQCNICWESSQTGKLLSRVLEHLYHFEHLWKSLNWVV